MASFFRNDYDFRAKSSEDVSLMIWDKFEGVDQIINEGNAERETLDRPGDDKNLILLGHDIGETGDGLRMKSLVKDIRKKYPESTIVSIDYSQIVGG